MKNLKEYIEECDGVALATPANTMGMGNPGMTDTNTMTEPIKPVTAKAKKEKLKKKIKESLLDDEDVLIGDVKKTTNPFVMIFNLLNSSKDIRDDFKTQTEIKKIFYKYLAEGLPYEATSNIRFRFTHQFFSTYISKLSYNEDLITITQNNLEAAKELNTHKGDNIAILFLDDKAFRRQVKEYGFKSLSDYRDWKNYIAAKYKLNKSKDNYIYTI